jgi:integrase
MGRTKRHASGSVCYDKRRGVWQWFYYADGKRRSKTIGTRQNYPTKGAAWIQVERMQASSEATSNEIPSGGDTVRSLIARYESERMPKRFSTAYTYRSFLRRVDARWGETPIRDLRPLEVELWLRELPLSPKSKTHLRSLLHILVEFAMFAGIIPIARNPISLVQNKGASKRTRKTRSLTVEEFHSLLRRLNEPFATIALVCVCLGLRISEALGLRWSDIDWLGAKLSVSRGVVMQHVDDCKTEGSAKTFTLAADLVQRLKNWKQLSQFSKSFDWIFASPFNIGRRPYSYTGTRQELVRAATAAGIGHLSTHAFRHTYRSWLDQVGTSLAVQQKAMRHTDLRMTMAYGDVVDNRVEQALEKVADLAFDKNSTQTARESS